MEVGFTGKITTIHHDENNGKSILYLEVNGEEVKIERPMLPAFEWQRLKGETIQSGDTVTVMITKNE